MSVLLYAIVTENSAPTTGEGLDGSALRPITVGGLTAVVSDHRQRPGTSEQALWAYHDAVQRLMARGAVLPVRFGTTFAGDAEVSTMLSRSHDELAAALKSVRGAVELGVRATWPTTADDGPPSSPSAGTATSAGTAYMEGRLDLNRRARALATKLDDELGELARASSSRLLARAATPVVASYLVDHERVDEFRARVDELDGATDEAEVVCTGPWPPYSFVESVSP
jgi:hypothetical protein